MNSVLSNQRRSAGLMSQVREDVSHLRKDIANLLSHTTHETLPASAREIVGQAKQQLNAGGAYMMSQLRDFKRPSGRTSGGILSGVAAVGLLAYGAYLLYQSRCRCEVDDEIVAENHLDSAENEVQEMTGTNE
jgi:uncharacterized membrane protein YebE (DUF533 family)